VFMSMTWTYSAHSGGSVGIFSFGSISSILAIIPNSARILYFVPGIATPVCENAKRIAFWVSRGWMFSKPRSTDPPLRKFSSGGTVPKLVCGASVRSISRIGSSKCLILS